MSMVIIIILMSKICEQTTSKIAHVQGLWFNNLFIYLFISNPHLLHLLITF